MRSRAHGLSRLQSTLVRSSYRSSPFSILLLLLALFVGPCVTSSAYADEDPGAREWNQIGGDAGWSYRCDLEPVRTEPTDRWRVKLPGDLIAGPVVWNGVVYLIVERFKRAELYSYRVADGKKAAGQRRLGDAGPYALGVWGGTVVTRSAEQIAAHTLFGKSLRQSWKTEETTRLSGPMRIAHGLAVLPSSTGARLFDVASGELVRRDPTHRSGTITVSALEPGGRLHMLSVETLREPGMFVVTSSGNMSAMDAKVEITRFQGGGSSDSIGLPPMMTQSKSTAPRDTVSVLLDDLGTRSPLLITAEHHFAFDPPLAATVVTRRGELGGLTLARAPTVVAGIAYGFDTSGGLVALSEKGQLPEVRLPEELRPFVGCAARSVVYFGNWALDTEGRRVLWSRPDLVPATPMIPAADGVAILVTDGNELVCIEGSAAAAVVADAERDFDGSSDSETGAPPPPPRSLEGVLLADGRQIDGTFEALGTKKARITPKDGGATIEIALSEIALVERGGKVVYRGSERAVLDCWRKPLRAAFAESLVDRAVAWKKKRLFSAAKELLREARAFDLDAARAELLQRQFTGQRDHSNAEVILKNEEEDARSARERSRRNFLEGADWLLARDMPTAAACLLADAERILPGAEEVRTRTKASIPPGCPVEGAEDPEARWRRWAEVLIVSDAVFATPDDPVLRNAPEFWREAAAIRTENLVCVTLEDDPEIVGSCVRYGERAIRTLRHFFATDTTLEPLEFRIHRDRDSYMAEKGNRIVEWSGGYYSPQEEVSRFFIPRGALTGAVATHEMFKVIAHELTHHFVDVAMTADVEPKHAIHDKPGFWIVEGIARFIEEQTAHSIEGQARFDDVTVPSLEITAAMHRKNKLFDTREFLGTSHEGFARISTEPMGIVNLPSTLMPIELTPLRLYYDQAGAVTFFLLNHRGPETPAQFIEYLRAFESGTVPSDSWKMFGFSSAEELDAAFKTFLDSLSAG